MNGEEELRVLICGVDGYIGFPLAMHLLKLGHSVYGVDCLLRRQMVSEVKCQSAIPISSLFWRGKILRHEFGDFHYQSLDIADPDKYQVLKRIFKKFKPESIVNLAQQPSPAYSMIDVHHANFTQQNNNRGLMNLLWCMREVTPLAPITTLGTMGEYEQPNMPIPEGFFKTTYKGMSDILPFPRLGPSFYHVSKTQSTKNLHFACRTWNVMGTDIHQGVVYGTRIPEMGDPPRPELRTRFDFDECFGTMINRACACAVTGHPIIAYGSGLQKRAYLALRDSIKCLTISVENPPSEEDAIDCYRVINQFDENYTCNEVADRVGKVAEKLGLAPTVKHIPNPRVESEIHYYNPEHKKLYNLGWKPTNTLNQELEIMLKDLMEYKDRIKKFEHKIIPKIKWRD